MKKQEKKKINPKQKQPRPGVESKMKPVPQTEPQEFTKGKLYNKVALITGGDSGIGKATALLFAKEGAMVSIAYLSEDNDAKATRDEIISKGGKCYLIKGDLSRENHCKNVIAKTIKQFGKLDIVINNAALHWETDSMEDITTRQLLKTFHTDFFAYFWIVKYALPHLKKGSSIVNTTSVTAYRGSPKLIDYSAAKGAIVSFTRSLAMNLIKKGIRVNGVAPGPIWTPLIVSTFDAKKVSEFGSDVPMKRPGMPDEVAPCFLFLASEDASYINGQILHPNGGEIING